MGKLLDSTGFKIGIIIFAFATTLGLNWFFNSQDEMKSVFDKKIPIQVEKIEIKSEGVKYPIAPLIQEVGAGLMELDANVSLTDEELEEERLNYYKKINDIVRSLKFETYEKYHLFFMGMLYLFPLIISATVFNFWGGFIWISLSITAFIGLNIGLIRDFTMDIILVLCCQFFASIFGLVFAIFGRSKYHNSLSGYRDEVVQFKNKNEQLKNANENLSTQVKKLDDKNMRLSAYKTKFYNLLKNLGGSLDLASALASLNDGLKELIGVEQAEILLFNNETKVLKVVSAVGWEHDPTVKEVFFKASPDSKMGWVVEKKKLLAEAAMKQDYSMANLANHEKLKTIMCTPLIQNEELVGVINIGKILASAMEDSDEAEIARNLYVVSTIAAMAISNARLFEKVREQAEIDGMTGMFCNRYMKEFMDKEIQKALRYSEKFSIVMTDIDHFKGFNDTYGHQIGDFVLIAVGNCMKGLVREGMDIAARYGGEEFMAVLTQTDEDSAYKFAERLRKLVEESTFHEPESNQNFNVHISIGVSTFPLHADSRDDLIKKADEALYYSKEGGRNRTTMAKV